MRRALLLLASLLALVALAGCGGGEDNSANQSTQPDQPGQTQATTADGETGETEAAGGDPTAGEEVFASAGCGGCHTLQAAGSSGSVGPNLDDAAPSADRVAEQVRTGGGGMPSFADQLSEQEIADVSAFVAESTKG